MARTILELPLDQVVPDEDQVRRYLDDGAGLRPLRDAIERWGQLHPIRVRPAERKFVIVDGERRWRALRQLRDRARKMRTGQTRFDHVLAIVGAEADEDVRKRRAIQVVSNMGTDLLPIEKARVIADLRQAARDSGKRLRSEEIAKMLGIPPGQVRHLLELATAPEFILEFGKPRIFQVAKKRNGEDSHDDGNVVTETVRRDALTTPFLRELYLAFKRLAKEDQRKLMENPEYIPRAARIARKLGLLAQREQWTFRELKTRAARMCAEKQGKKAGERTSATRMIHQLAELAESFLATDPPELPEAQRIAVAGVLRRVCERLSVDAPG